jgi:prevent-host-death family protein
MTMDMTVKIPAGEFKAKCLQLMDRVARSGEPIVITKRGRPVAKLVPADEPEPLFGYMAGTARVVGEIITAPHLDWSALSGDEDDLYNDLESPAPSAGVRESARKRRRK